MARRSITSSLPKNPRIDSENGMEMPKVGRGWGENDKNRKGVTKINP